MDAARLSRGVVADERDRVGVGRVVLDVVGATTSNGIRSCSRIARRCGEVEASTSVVTHAGFSATQISSVGHCRAHSTENAV